MRVLHVLGLLGAALTLFPATARADNYEEFGLGARAQAMGNAATGLATDPTATYYNPAGLIYSRHINLHLGFSFADYGLSFSSQRGGALDDGAERIPDLSTISLGFSTTIPIDIPDRIGLGLAIYTPTRGIVDLEARAITSDPEWFKYGDRHDRLDVLLAVAVKVNDWLSIGVGASLLVGVQGGTTISAGITAPVDPEFKAKVGPGGRAIVGVRMDPANWISIGLTYRSEVSVNLKFPAQVLFQGINIPVDLDATQFFSPHQIQLGLALSPLDSLLVTFDLMWSQWSEYDDLFLIVSSDVASVLPKTNADLVDVFSPRLGAELAVTDWLLLRAGYWYRSSSVDDQDDELTNLVDSDKHVLTLGLGLAFGAEPEETTDEAKPTRRKRSQTMEEALEDASLDIDLVFQVHFHTQASATKPASDPIGSWDADGQIYNFGLNLTARF